MEHARRKHKRRQDPMRMIGDGVACARDTLLDSDLRAFKKHRLNLHYLRVICRRATRNNTKICPHAALFRRAFDRAGFFVTLCKIFFTDMRKTALATGRDDQNRANRHRVIRDEGGV